MSWTPTPFQNFALVLGLVGLSVALFIKDRQYIAHKKRAEDLQREVEILRGQAPSACLMSNMAAHSNMLSMPKTTNTVEGSIS